MAAALQREVDEHVEIQHSPTDVYAEGEMRTGPAFWQAQWDLRQRQADFEAAAAEVASRD